MIQRAAYSSMWKGGARLRDSSRAGSALVGEVNASGAILQRHIPGVGSDERITPYTSSGNHGLNPALAKPRHKDRNSQAADQRAA